MPKLSITIIIITAITLARGTELRSPATGQGISSILAAIMLINMVDIPARLESTPTELMPPQVYVAPQIYSGPPSYGGPAYGNTGGWNAGVATPNLLAMPANNVPPNVVPGAAVGASGKVLITNPADSGGDVNYVLNGNNFSIQPGQTQSLDNDRVWTIDFASGGQRGGVRYTLSPGQFKFVVKESGWELVRVANQSMNSGQAAQTQIPPAPLPTLDAGTSSPAPAPFNPPPK